MEAKKLLKKKLKGGTEEHEGEETVITSGAKRVGKECLGEES